MPALRHPINSDVNVDGVTLSFFPLPCYHMFSARMRFSKLVTSFRVHTKQRGRDDGTLAQDYSQSSGQGAWVFPVGTERGGTPL